MIRSVINSVMTLTLSSQKTILMGVLNITPNSFSDGGKYLDVNAASRRAQEMIKQGADLIDVGGEASNPGAESISADEELSRVIPVIRAIRDISDVPISIDTCKAIVMSEAISAGASMINDISALTGENALNVAAALHVPICLMHMNGVPRTMQDDLSDDIDVVEDIHQFFTQRIAACLTAGVTRERLILDPGIGFGKTVEHNLDILKHLSAFHRHELPLLLGVSRKRVIGEVLQKPVSDRLIGGLAIAANAVMQGVKIIRTHDIEETRQVLQMMNAIFGGLDKPDAKRRMQLCPNDERS